MDTDTVVYIGWERLPKTYINYTILQARRLHHMKLRWWLLSDDDGRTHGGRLQKFREKKIMMRNDGE